MAPMADHASRPIWYRGFARRDRFRGPAATSQTIALATIRGSIQNYCRLEECVQMTLPSRSSQSVTPPLRTRNHSATAWLFGGGPPPR
jgi:hypothetical protein